MNAAKQKFDQNEKRLEQLAQEGKYFTKASEDQFVRDLTPLARRLEKEQDRLLAILEA